MAEQQNLPLAFTFPQTAVMSVEQLWHLADAELLKILKEDRRVERKPVGIKSHDLADYFSMWANTGAEGGLIAVGVSNDGGLLGCLSIEIEHINQLEHEGQNQCPHAHIQSKRVPIRRDKDRQADFVLLFRVDFNETRVVFTARNEAFIRRGESKHRLTHDEIRDLQNDKQEVSIEQELVSTYTFPDDFDGELIEDFSTTVRSNLKEPISTEDLLVTRNLGRMKDGRFIPNAACILTFAKNPRAAFPGAKIQLLRFEGDAEGTGKQWNAVKELFVEGPIPRLIRATEEFLDGQLRQFSRPGPDGRFYTAPEYPKDAWYEAIVNACVHRSYGAVKNMAIVVKMFDSRLEVESPGGFMPGVTPDNIYTISHPRNPFIMEAMWFLRYVKSMHEGTRRMLKVMQDSDLPAPEFRQKEIGYAVVRVTLRNNIRQRQAWIDSEAAASVISPEIYATLTPDEKTVINHVAEHGTINTTQAVRITKKGWKAAHKLLLRLAAKDLLKHHHRADIERDPQAFFSIDRRKRLP